MLSTHSNFIGTHVVSILNYKPYHTPLKDWYPIKEVDDISPTYLSCTIILKADLTYLVEAILKTK